MPADGYDVIDFDYWVADVADQGLTTDIKGKGRTPLNDVLFTVCILAREYHEETETLSDGSTQTVKVPNETWAYVSCYCLNGKLLEHVILPQEELIGAGRNYLSMCYPLKDSDTNSPSASPRIAGTIRKRYGDEDAVMYQYEVVTNPLSVDSRAKNGYWFGDVVLASSSYEDRVKSAEYNKARRISYGDRSMNKKLYGDYRDFPKDDDRITHFYLAGAIGSQSGLYDLMYGMDTVFPQGALKNIAPMEGKRLASSVVSLAARNKVEGKPHLFFLQQTADGERYRLMGCISTTIQKDGVYYWTLRDYDLDMPRTDLQWTELYGRECVYWMETAGQTEDGKGNLFRVRAVWYDETADAVSEPFVIATVQTPTADGVPMNIRLAGSDEGYYVVRRENGTIQLYRFNFQLVPGLRLVGNALTETLANSGSYDDMLLTVYNNGNIPLTGFDLVAYHQQDGKAAEAFETIHLDLMNPSQNTVTLRKGLDGAKEQRYGENVARAVESSLSLEGSEYRYAKSTDYYTSVNGNKAMEERQELMKPNMLMPSGFKSFIISLLIPQTWEGSHSIYLEVDRFYTSNGASFQKNVNGNSGGGMRLMAAMPQDEIVSIGRDGTVRKENSGGMRLFAARNGAAETKEDLSMYKTDVTFDRIELNNEANDLMIEAKLWDNNGEPMVSLTVTNWAHIKSSARNANAVVMEAFLDEEAEPVFRYSLPEEVSDKETWNFDMPRPCSRITATPAK